MIYPKKINANKTDKVMKALLIASVVLSGILILIDKLTSNKISWSALNQIEQHLSQMSSSLSFYAQSN